MHWLSNLMKRTATGVRIDAPEGEVWLRPTTRGIKAEYMNGPLANASASAYARAVKRAALDYARGLELPWSSGPEQAIRIKDPMLYYEQTFRPDILAAETLLRWESRSHASQAGI